ncbi:hypothetical protein PGT21_027469 [Puccinia graminis f. sp. tritici]|uniref:Uncharacterized protein n=1 Tax=Puccinia graminis f. sp. tritici TaxID=56615 RepID=A0A5B0RME9_PUCGR|nr:hypothetical protein PGT21_027469 [Puccinia graminis f. sp. tritici]KAA1127111.1 hypothetical protein PGTUg99_022678 [Puccinia graminis f. sp. tritici]
MAPSESASPTLAVSPTPEMKITTLEKGSLPPMSKKTLEKGSLPPTINVILPATNTTSPLTPVIDPTLETSTLPRPKITAGNESTTSGPPEVFAPIPPPPESIYKTKEAMIESIQNWALNHGYAIVVGNSAFVRH